MRRLAKKFGLAAIASLVLASCREGAGLPENAAGPLSDGMYTLVETDSGTFQTTQKVPVPERMAQLGTPGLSLALIDGYQLSNTLAFGNRDTLHPVTARTLFEAASVSKLVTAVMVHHFVAQGLLDLDVDVNRYLKTWKVPETEFTHDHPITLRLLLSHQSGLPSSNFDYDRALGRPTLKQLLAGEPPARNPPALPAVAPGTAWDYSNLGYALIQMVLEDATGKPLEALASEVIFKPLKMQGSTFAFPLPDSLKHREALPFDRDGRQRAPDLDSPARAQGGLLTTPSDLARLVLEIGKAHQGTSLIFAREVGQNLMEKQVKLPFDFYGQTAYMGLGALVLGEGEATAFLHNGYNAPGSVCLVIGFPYLGKGAVVASNSANGEQLYLEVIATLAGEYNWPQGRFFPQGLRR